MSRAGKWRFRLAITVIACLGAYAIKQSLEAHRDATHFHDEVSWLIQNETALRTTAAPNPTLGEDRLVWITPDHLLFTNGSAAYRLHSIHSGDMSDLALLRFSGGETFFSQKHFCVGIGEWIPEEVSTHAPFDQHDFLTRYGIGQEWHSVDQSGFPSCLVIAHRDFQFFRPIQKVWVWISTGQGDGRLTVMEKCFQLKGPGVSWNARWTSNNQLQILLFHRDASSGRTNHLRTLNFRRDEPSGKFIEQKS